MRETQRERGGQFSNKIKLKKLQMLFRNHLKYNRFSFRSFLFSYYHLSNRMFQIINFLMAQKKNFQNVLYKSNFVFDALFLLFFRYYFYKFIYSKTILLQDFYTCPATSFGIKHKGFRDGYWTRLKKKIKKKKERDD